jgi:hypothetical protein
VSVGAPQVTISTRLDSYARIRVEVEWRGRAVLGGVPCDAAAVHVGVTCEPAATLSAVASPA